LVVGRTKILQPTGPRTVLGEPVEGLQWFVRCGCIRLGYAYGAVRGVRA
jgi:hypothetical protein